MKGPAIATAALVLVGFYAAYLAVLYPSQRGLVYPGAGPRQRPPLAADRADRQLLWLQTGFGPVEAWLLPPRGASASIPTPAVIVGHGNAETIDAIPAGFLGWRDLGYAVLLVEYPGYGDSAGEPSVASVTEAFVAAYDALAAHPEVDGQRILGMGRSLGGGAVCALAARRPLAALVLVATFADLPSLARRFLAPAALVRERYDNAAVLAAFDGPVFIAHGTRDDLIPLAHARRNAAAARRGRLVTYDAGHGDCPGDFETFWRDVGTFLAEERAAD